MILPPPAEAVTFHAPAKVNLALHVVGRRSDGYHLLESPVVFCAVGDTLRAAPSPVDGFSVSGRFAASVPLDDGNLVIRARDMFRLKHPDRTGSVSLSLAKELPVASGIGGGSSDAAATLLAMSGMAGLPMDNGSVQDIARALGADVPMCVAGRSLVARGIGHDLAPIGPLPDFHLVLANPGVAVATADIFRRLDRCDNDPLPPMPDGPDLLSFVDWLGHCRNDLEGPAIAVAPQIAGTLDALRATGAAMARMSGSGATCFGLYVDATAAADAAARIAASNPHWFVRATGRYDRTGPA